ncbi:hypothetical protein ERO13_A12G205700v2 [Gossypium hirsutum]|uniref:LOB domain-containing protein n=1 Tax=Gossypium tomentosum TaxID=34277 RepID=A0A5D2N0A6_GOSTO|nr:hypothetical protein ERO13_A12G205700v2 [Gossypium hirsutum]TYH97326.1 hypothetical protein ES332_A12G235600v1 [Gossypium tomentosum]
MDSIFPENSGLLLCFTLLGGCGLGIENQDKRNGEGKQASSCFSIAIRLHRRCAHQSRHCRKAVVNKDASGDVVAMRLQIQQLKKEVSHLRAFVNGKSENLDNDNLASSIPASPGPFKWECPPGSFSPLSSDKTMSQKKDYEVALVGAFKREREKEAALQALTAENQAAMQLMVWGRLSGEPQRVLLTTNVGIMLLV